MTDLAYFLIGAAFGSLLIEGVYLRAYRPIHRPEPRRPFLELD